MRCSVHSTQYSVDFPTGSLNTAAVPSLTTMIRPTFHLVSTYQLHLTSIRVEADGSLVATFPTAAGSNEAVHLQPSPSEQTREVWTASVAGHDYKAKAIPHSEETYSFRFEIRRNGKLISGSQVFCAICNSKVHLQK